MRLPELLVALLLGATAAVAAAPPKPLAVKEGPVPRAADGHADLSGVWSNASITKLTRLPGTKSLTISAAEAKALGENNPMLKRLDADAEATKASEGAPVVGGDPGGYNSFWLDPGRTLGHVKGEYRTSWIVDTPDGQLPFSAAGKALVAKANAYSRAADTPANPEAMEPWDRCLISSRGSGGPGMLNNIYNSNYQILQTRGSVAIVIEMIHDARGVTLYPTKAAAQAAHGPPALHLWLGDSTGWWEGDTLVIETINVNGEQGRAGPIFLTPQGRVTERLTRVSAGQIFYEFLVEDPTYYTKAWRAEMSLNAMKDQLFEYACHEGNYALPDIMSGVRAAEAGGKAKGGQ